MAVMTSVSTYNIHNSIVEFEGSGAASVVKISKDLLKDSRDVFHVEKEDLGLWRVMAL